MSKMNEISLDITELLEQGRSPEHIAQKLSVPLDWVLGVELNLINYPQDSYDCYDTVNS